MPTLVRITTVPISLQLLLTGQPKYMTARDLKTYMVSADGPELPAVRANESCPHKVIPFTRKITPWHDLRCLLKLITLLREINPDIVHTHTPKAGLIGMLAAKIAGVPVRIHTVAGLPMMTAEGWKRGLLIITEKITAWAAHKVLPNSTSLRNYIRDENLVPDHKIEVIGDGSTNGIDLGRFNRTVLDEEKIAALRKNYGFYEITKVILFVGRMVNDKGVPELVRAFQSLRDREELRLLLVGPLETERGNEVLPAEILRQIRDNSKITHIPWSDEIEYHMAASDLLCHPSHREGFPNVLLQAGAMKLPIVCSDIPGNIDIVTGDGEGWLHQVGDEVDLSRALRSALKEIDSSAQERADKLHDIVIGRYDQKKMHQAIFDYYQHQLNRLPTQST